MILTKVSIAGPDNDVKHEDLLALSKEFPFVEWAILIASPDRNGTHRYPDILWRTKFSGEILPLACMNACAHYCGPKVMDWLHGKIGHALYKRVQLNVRELTAEQVDLIKARAEHFSGVDIIVPLKHGTKDIWKEFQGYQNIVFLYDASGGHGKTPTFWRKPIAGHLTGYAGGLGPENIKEVLKGLDFLIGDGYTWVDMESNVRTDNKLDLGKVRMVLEAAKPYVDMRA